MSILKEMNHFYYQMSLFELQTLSDTDSYQGLSYNSMLYLNVIDLMPECTVSKLAQLLNITKSAVTIKVNELKKQGTIIKTQSTKDKRVYYLSLSAKMKHTFNVYDDTFVKMEKQLRDVYSDQELLLFKNILHTAASYDWRNFKNE